MPAELQRLWMQQPQAAVQCDAGHPPDPQLQTPVPAHGSPVEPGPVPQQEQFHAP
jgi:hypothetical protein